jgi:anti-sigma regulatory factor (Ser/Thr protein kinase)
LYALVDPASGYIRYANAGHNVPYQRKEDGVVELRARGMPLGLMPEMAYEEKETTLRVGENIFLYSDGLVEAHNPQGEMFGNPRLRSLIDAPTCSSELIDCLMNELASFTGAGWEQEDDVTFVTLERTPAGAWRTLEEFSLPSQANNERQAMERVASAVSSLGLAPKRLERLKTAVAEATMNAMEHGNQYREDQPVQISVLANETDVAVHILDFGKFQDLPVAEAPDLDAKLAGLQSPRGWGLFLIQNMVDEMRETSVDGRHNLELIMHLKGE